MRASSIHRRDLGLLASVLMLLAGAPALHASNLDRSRALETTPEGAAAAQRVLADYAQRGAGEAGFAWWLSLPIGVRAQLAARPPVQVLRNRLELQRDHHRGDAEACALSGPKLLQDPLLGCAYAEELERYLACIDPLPERRREPLMQAARVEAETRLAADLHRCTAIGPLVQAARGRLRPPAPR
jgi:hypothetical protein